MDHSIIIGFVIVVIVCLQLYFFIENIRKMNEFKTIFYSKDNDLIKFTAHTGSENGEIQGVTASTNNRILKDILEAINTYIKSKKQLIAPIIDLFIFIHLPAFFSQC